MIDFTPLFRTAIGFDRLANTLENAHRADAEKRLAGSSKGT